MWFKSCRSVILWYTFMVSLDAARCNAISNAQFNASLRDYTAQDASTNTTEVRTLQKEYERYAGVSPITSHIRFKDVPDSALSPTTGHSRGFLQRGHKGYGYVDYEENPLIGHEYNFQEEHGHFEGHHHLDHHHLHHNDHHGHGYHHKHYDHALAANAVLWPIAGIALLGAAAALVTNPILLQLGVVSGRRRRRDAEHDADKLPHISKPASKVEEHAMDKRKLLNNDNKVMSSRLKKVINHHFETRPLFNEEVKYNRRQSRRQKPVTTSVQTNEHLEYDPGPDDKEYIPIPLQIKD